MTDTRARAVAAGAVAALFLAPLAACGSDEKPSATKHPASASSSVTPDASESAEPSADDSSPSPASGSTVDADDFAELITAAIAQKKTAHMTMDMGSALRAEGDVRYGESGSEMRMTMGMGGQDMTMLVTGGTLYLQMPGMTPAGKWAKVDKDNPAMGQLVEQMDAMGPTGSLEVMKKGLQDVRLVGKEDVKGEELNHYKVTVDPKAAADAMGALGKRAGDLPSSIAYDLYLDDDNLMRRVVIDISGQQMVMELSDWGKPVDIKAPPAGDVVELSQMGATG